MTRESGFSERFRRVLLSELDIALHIPDDWSRVTTEAGLPVAYGKAVFRAPEEQGYHSSIVISRARASLNNPRQFEDMIAEVRARMNASPEIEIIGDGRANQNSMPAWILRYRRESPGCPHDFEQILVLLVTDIVRGRVLQIDASTINPLAHTHIPVLMQILESLEPAGTP